MPSAADILEPLNTRAIVIDHSSASHPFLSRPLFGALLFPNESSDARDHCANERTFLSWLRLSVYMAVVSVAIVISFHLKSQPTSVEKRIALPVGLIFWLLSLACLISGFANYVKTVRKYGERKALVQSGWKTQVIIINLADLDAENTNAEQRSKSWERGKADFGGCGTGRIICGATRAEVEDASAAHGAANFRRSKSIDESLSESSVVPIGLSELIIWPVFAPEQRDKFYTFTAGQRRFKQSSLQELDAMSTTTTQIRTITTDNAIRLFPDVDIQIASANRAAFNNNNDLEGYDEEQIRLMDEVCIVLDENDNPIGSASKKVCHLMKNIEAGLLHRAFSVFLFDSNDRLLLQQRASEKITFPDMWTNTCCSHPLGVPGETGSDLAASVQGVKRAAQRKLDQELGIKAKQVPLDKFQFLTRIHYKAPSDGEWGEHEIDYILFIKAEVDHTPNPNEVQDTKYVSKKEMKTMFEDNSLKFTPWFKLICNSMLFEWWEYLDEGLDKYTGETEIRRM